MDSSMIECIDTNDASSVPLCEGGEVNSSDFSGNFEQTIAMLDMDLEEVMFEVQNCHEEVSLNFEIK
jgi:hypothetical protein